MRKLGIILGAAMHAAASAGAHAGAMSGIVTFSEVPVGASLDGLVINGLGFSYHPNGSGLADPVVSDIPGTVSGLRDDITLRGSAPSNLYTIGLAFPGSVKDFGLSLSTQPFSSLAPISAHVQFFNAGGDMVIEYPEMSMTLFPGATLPDGTTIFRVGRSDIDLHMSGVYDAVRAEVRVVGANPSGWYMDNVSYTTIPGPGAASLVGVSALVFFPRRRRDHRPMARP